MMYPGDMAKKLKVQNFQGRLQQAEENARRASDPNVSKSMTDKEREEALNRPQRLLESIGGFTSNGYKPGQFVQDERGNMRFIPRYRDTLR